MNDEKRGGGGGILLFLFIEVDRILILFFFNCNILRIECYIFGTVSLLKNHGADNIQKH